METYRIHRKQALDMEEVIDQYIRSMKLAAGLNTQRVFAAWDDVSGAGSATLRRYYRDGVLRVSLSSSVLRFELGLQKAQIIERMNAWLLQDDLFIKDDPKVGLVKDIILK
jgi:hypothetical protein